jgi:hypothetical protein
VLPERFRRPVPWRLGDLLVLYACTALGALLVAVAWFGASSSVRVASQVRWTNIGVGGLIVFGAGSLAWLLTGRRAVGELRRHLLPLIPVPEQPAVEGRAPASPTTNGALVSVRGMTHYHRAACIFVAGKDVEKASERTFRRRGRTPCAACRPTEDDAER